MLQTEAELREMAAMGAQAGMEVSLFVGPRAGWDIGAHARSAEGSTHAYRLRGMRQLAYAVEDIVRAVACGIRGFLVADEGLLVVLVALQREGALPADIVWKVSVAMGGSNPASVRLLEQLGASTINIPSDTSLGELAEIRAAVRVPLDLYVESPDGLGGVVRGHEVGSLIAAGAPLYVKFGLRNSRGLYPAGEHLMAEAIAIAREKVRRAAIGMEWLRRTGPDVVTSAPGGPGLGVPVR
jgi:hypothetical protein